MPGNISESAKVLVKLIEQLPEERIKHLVSFKDIQLKRFRPVAGISNSDEPAPKKPTLAEIKDIINRTKSPLGLQNDVLKKIAQATPKETFTVDSIDQQIKSLKALCENKYKTYYDVGNKLYRPAGNPNYYQRLLDELDGKRKENIFTAFRTVVFGK
ncbi:related to Cytochrome B pre-mRNA-processing protein 6 [Saccharomycodes ludwigii]|uniref:Related to Cytochrome B pre-mRNA-processing protein 6 n=1 Tax=Saccharomycodes ludwigii TaxID=36035 RepID=A0A376B774_9ASCO|nr:hypothetical protein SCDLUD_000548 [Saccharomycodes ludwigii]KAH3902949.1 hypothetical protein SCDLUD_000548 [Saccharomycodes ludwigii]SSD60429.1 related to Cytochrome B pre-mRNA-processing protein 6 [Saccharomycodes ludwigii]